MRTKVTLVLLFLNVALFFFIFAFVRKWQTDVLWEESRRRVLGPEAAAIQSLDITGGRLAEPVRLEKRADGWILTKPIEWPANSHAVSRMLNELMFLEHETSFLVKDLAKSGLSLADYGLDRPQLTLTFTAGVAGSGTPSTTTTLQIGDTTKVGNRLYVLSPDGQRIHVVGRSLADSLALTLDQLRADTVFNIPLFEVRSFNLQTAASANLRIRLRREGPAWLFEAPILARADRTKVELAINGLDALRARSFVDPAAVGADQTGLANPAYRVTLEGNGRRETLLLGNALAPAAAEAKPATPETKPPAPEIKPPAPAAPEARPPAATTPDTKPAAAAPDEPAAEPATNYYAKMEDRAPVFTVAVSDALFAVLRNAQDQLRDRHLLSFDSRTLTSITLTTPNQPELTLQRLETGQQPLDTDPWQIVTRTANQAPQTQPADLAHVRRLIERLYLLQAEEFLRDAPQAIELENWGFNRPERQITLNFSTRGALAAGALPAGATPAAVTLVLGVASERENRVYAKLADEPFVYLVAPEILRETPVAANYYRDRLLRELPAGARITGLTLTDLATKAVIFSRQLGAGATWEQVLATEPADRRAALEALLEQLRSLRARSFVLETFPPTVEVAGEVRPWRYSLEATLSLVGGPAVQTAASTLYFTERTGGTTQLAGSPEFNAVFVADQKLIDALFALTFGPHDPGPAASAAPAPVDVPAPARPAQP